MAFMALYVFLFGVTLGPRATKQWLIGEILSFIMDLCLLLPMRILAKSVALSSVVSGDVQELYDLIAKRSRLVMLRRAGTIKYANSMIQHFNPACRAARSFPELDVSRLLMSFNDNDFPSQLVKKKRHWSLVLVGVFVFGFIVLFGLLNEVLQDIVLELSVTIGVNAGLLGLAFANKYSNYIPAAIAGFVFIIIVVVSYLDRSYYFLQRNLTQGVSGIPIETINDSQVLDGMIDLEKRSKPNFKDKWNLKVLATRQRIVKEKSQQMKIEAEIEDITTKDESSLFDIFNRTTFRDNNREEVYKLNNISSFYFDRGQSVKSIELPLGTQLFHHQHQYHQQLPFTAERSLGIMADSIAQAESRANQMAAYRLSSTSPEPKLPSSISKPSQQFLSSAATYSKPHSISPSSGQKDIHPFTSPVAAAAAADNNKHIDSKHKPSHQIISPGNTTQTFASPSRVLSTAGRSSLPQRNLLDFSPVSTLSPNHSHTADQSKYAHIHGRSGIPFSHTQQADFKAPELQVLKPVLIRPKAQPTPRTVPFHSKAIVVPISTVEEFQLAGLFGLDEEKEESKSTSVRRFDDSNV